MEEKKRIKIEDLKEFCRQALEQEGMQPENAAITAEVLAETDAFGTHSHGTKNLHNYIRKCRAGGMDLLAQPELIREGPGTALLDAHAAVGMVAAYKAMELAIEKAAGCGIACVVVKNSSHFGAAGYYANMAAKHHMIGLALTNVDNNMTIPGARGKVLGNNPLAYAAPAGAYPPVFLDIAMSQVASLKVIKARAEGSAVPDNWIVDGEGRPTTDPSCYPEEGAMQPMAAHKGYGLALLCELLTGVLSGGGTMEQVPSWLFEMEKKNDVSHCFIVIDVSRFMDAGAFEERMEDVTMRIRQAPKAPGVERLYCPGEMEWERHGAAEQEGILLPEDVGASLEGLAAESGLTLAWF